MQESQRHVPWGGGSCPERTIGVSQARGDLGRGSECPGLGEREPERRTWSCNWAVKDKKGLDSPALAGTPGGAGSIIPINSYQENNL